MENNNNKLQMPLPRMDLITGNQAKAAGVQSARQGSGLFE